MPPIPLRDPPSLRTRPPARRLRALAAAALSLLAACDGPQSMLAPDGSPAADVARLWWVLLAVGTAVFLATMAGLLRAVARRRDWEGEAPPLPLTPGSQEETRRDASERRTEVRVRLDTRGIDRRAVRWVLGLGVGVSSAILLGTLLVTLTTLARTSGDGPAALTVEVTGRQWWWEVRYLAPDGTPLFETANEIHVPVGRRVRLRLRSADVIHSFWVPPLAGKTDMIPGRTTQAWLQADRAGVFRGQCAEYCAGPHALMSMLVIAQPEAEFRAWAAAQREPARPPADPLAARGREVFVRTACSACHAVRGVTRGEKPGPDLTHLAARRTLAAVTLPNTPGHLGGWLADPQALKPGARMPAVPLSGPESTALLHYLRGLE